jgi:hypothetical protein
METKIVGSVCVGFCREGSKDESKVSRICFCAFL